MLTFKPLIIILSLVALTSCKRTDFSNPEEVVKNYKQLSQENKNEILYDDYISAKSKDFVTKDEFIRARNISDSLIKYTRYLGTKVLTFPVDIANPSLRRFKVEEELVFKLDTIFRKHYYTLSNENGKWKVIWTGTLSDFARQKYEGGNYSEARKSLEKIIELDPYNGSNYSQLAWSYYRDASLPKSEWENGVVKNAKYAVTLEEDKSGHYNTLAAYYSMVGNSDLAIENYKRGLQFCQNKWEKTTFLSNLAHEYIDLREYGLAEDFLTQSIGIDSSGGFEWLTYGRLEVARNKNAKAIIYFKKALNKPRMENALQSELYYMYSYSSLQVGNCKNAKDYINKALDIDPNNELYQFLYQKILTCR
jgi:Tfp pilus assembly protein PilF